MHAVISKTYVKAQIHLTRLVAIFMIAAHEDSCYLTCVAFYVAIRYREFVGIIADPKGFDE